MDPTFPFIRLFRIGLSYPEAYRPRKRHLHDNKHYNLLSLGQTQVTVGLHSIPTHTDAISDFPCHRRRQGGLEGLSPPKKWGRGGGVKKQRKEVLFFLKEETD